MDERGIGFAFEKLLEDIHTHTHTHTRPRVSRV